MCKNKYVNDKLRICRGNIVDDEQNRVFNFKKQLSIGEKGEISFYNKFKSELEVKKNCRDPDFRIIKTGELIELKTDGYILSNRFYKNEDGSIETPNLFIERFSDNKSETIGGPWRAKSEGCTYFVYYFINNSIFFMFNNNQLVSTLDEITKNRSLIGVENEGWVTVGYPISRIVLTPISYKFDVDKCVSISECITKLNRKINRIDLSKYIQWTQKVLRVPYADQLNFLFDESAYLK